MLRKRVGDERETSRGCCESEFSRRVIFADRLTDAKLLFGTIFGSLLFDKNEFHIHGQETILAILLVAFIRY